MNRRQVNNFTDEAKDEVEFRKLARQIGWACVSVGNGAFWDYCPECAGAVKPTPDPMAFTDGEIDER
jgi:hypothetical protein